MFSAINYGTGGTAVPAHDAANAAAAGGANQAVMPVLVTEHQSHTNAVWSTLSSNCDSPFEASRLANQILSNAQFGFESCACAPHVVLGLHLRSAPDASPPPPFPTHQTSSSLARRR